MSEKFQNRIFVPLTKEAFDWFLRGKEWEVRKLNVGQYNLKNIRLSRAVELRLGYQPGKSIWGLVSDVRTFTSAYELFEAIWYRKIVPVAESEKEAREFVSKYVGSKNEIIAFKIEIDL